MDNKVEIQYCEKCGTVLDYEYYFVRYSSENGHKLYRIKATCPKREYWWDGHSNHWLDDFYGHRYFYKDGQEVGIVVP